MRLGTRSALSLRARSVWRACLPTAVGRKSPDESAPGGAQAKNRRGPRQRANAALVSPRSRPQARGVSSERWPATGRSCPMKTLSWFIQARMTWTAAAFARYSPPHHDEFVRYARHGIEFLDSVLRDKEFGGFHWVLGPRAGSIPGTATRSTLYGTAFVIYAASTVREVTGDERALARSPAMRSTGSNSTPTTRSTAAISRRSAATARRSLSWDQTAPIQAAPRPRRRLLRLQVDERPYSSAGGAHRAVEG